MMMIFLLRGASTAKQSQGLSCAEPNSQERAGAPPEAGVHSREAGGHSQGPPKASPSPSTHHAGTHRTRKRRSQI